VLKCKLKKLDGKIPDDKNPQGSIEPCGRFANWQSVTHRDVPGPTLAGTGGLDEEHIADVCLIQSRRQNALVVTFLSSLTGLWRFFHP
jgi:hypothetical protein